MTYDPDLQTLSKFIAVGWPSDKHEVPEAAVHYFHFQDEASEQDGIISCVIQAVIPSNLGRAMLEWIHSAHMAIEGCLRRARECLYWPSMSSAIKDYMDKCSICHSFDSKQANAKKRCILIKCQVDRGRKLGQTSSAGMSSIILSQRIITLDSGKLMHCQAPHLVLSQTSLKPTSHAMVFLMCASQTMDLSFHRKNSKCLVIKWQFEHKTSSPGYPQSKGKAEQAAKAAKTLMKKAKKAGTDPYLSLLSHRNTATQGLDSSPVQRLMSRRTKTLLPGTVNLLTPMLFVNVDKKLCVC